MSEKPDRALGALLVIVMAGFLLGPIIVFVWIRGLTGTLAFLVALIAFAALTAAVASAAVWLTRRCNRWLAVVLWTAAWPGCLYWANLYGSGVLEKTWWSTLLVMSVLLACTVAWFEAVLGPGSMGHWSKNRSKHPPDSTDA